MIESAAASIDLIFGTLRPYLEFVEQQPHPWATGHKEIAALHLRAERLGAYFLLAGHLVDEHAIAHEIAHCGFGGFLAARSRLLLDADLIGAPRIRIVLSPGLYLLLTIKRSPLAARHMSDGDAVVFH